MFKEFLGILAAIVVAVAIAVLLAFGGYEKIGRAHV